MYLGGEEAIELVSNDPNPPGVRLLVDCHHDAARPASHH